MYFLLTSAHLLHSNVFIVFVSISCILCAAELSGGDGGEGSAISPLWLPPTLLHLRSYWRLQSSKAGVSLQVCAVRGCLQPNAWNEKICDRLFTTQVYELHNGGAVPVCYDVDTAVLSQLQDDNFDHPVLRCLNPQGEIPPGKTAKLEWIFSPLEAKTYHVRMTSYSAHLTLSSGYLHNLIPEKLGCCLKM